MALDEIQNQTKIQGIFFENKICFTKSMVATYFEIETRTLERYVSEFQDEISTSGKTKYINQRDSEFIGAFLQEENYRREFTDALRDYVDMGNAKYGIYTDKIYQSIFREKAKEYKQVLKLSDKDRVRDTFYSEVLTLISSYECGLAENQDVLQRLKESE